MIDGQRILAIIPARGGSKGIPRKNIYPFAGKPLIAWTIEAAKRSRYLDRIILSSDDPEIVAVAHEWGCDVPFLRPSELARDDTPGIDPILHALNALPERYDYVVMLQPTSPLRTAQDIDGCVELCVRKVHPAVVSLVEPSHHPQWMFTADQQLKLSPLFEQRALRRQDLPSMYALNGAVYVAQTAWLEQTRSFLGEGVAGYAMPAERSIDIDQPSDLIQAECLLNSVFPDKR